MRNQTLTWDTVLNKAKIWFVSYVCEWNNYAPLPHIPIVPHIWGTNIEGITVAEMMYVKWWNTSTTYMGNKGVNKKLYR